MATSDIDWLDEPWTGGNDFEDLDDLYEDLPLCGAWCDDCWICQTARAAMRRIFLPIYGPVNRDGEPMGFLIVAY